MVIDKSDLNKIDMILNKRIRSGLEVLLVLAGSKPGDFIRKTNPLYRDIKKILFQIDNLNIIEREEMILFYNSSYLEQEIVHELKKIKKFNPKSDIILEDTPFVELTQLMGKFFGYPPCCIEAYLENKTLSRYKPFTEHLWCSEDCCASKKIQERNKKILEKYYPNHIENFLKFGNLA